MIKFMAYPMLRGRRAILDTLERSLLGRMILSSVRRDSESAIRIISATRMTSDAFWTQSALGQSLQSIRDVGGIHFHIHCNNSVGLSELYNIYIEKSNVDDILVFIHDDVWVETEDWIERLRKGLTRFDIIGVAGNKRLADTQPAWAFRAVDGFGFHWDTGHLSGRVGHGKSKGGPISNYGPVPTRCAVLDGVLIAARCKFLLFAGIKFDPQFRFHFYDVDFCRQANSRCLRLGTWDIPITHQSGGSFGSTDWQLGYVAYLRKWSGNNPKYHGAEK